MGSIRHTLISTFLKRMKFSDKWSTEKECIFLSSLLHMNTAFSSHYVYYTCAPLIFFIHVHCVYMFHLDV